MAERNILKIKAKTQIIGFKEYWISLLITLDCFMLLQKFGIGIALLTIGFATFKHRDCRKGDESDAFYHTYTCVCLQILDCNAVSSLDYYYFFYSEIISLTFLNLKTIYLQKVLLEYIHMNYISYCYCRWKDLRKQLYI